MSRAVIPFRFLTVALSVIVAATGLAMLTGCGANSDSNDEAPAIRRLNEDDLASKNDFSFPDSLTDKELDELIKDSLDDESMRKHLNMTKNEYERYRDYYQTFEYYGDTLYDIDVSDYSEPGEHVLMFPTVVEIIDDGDSAPNLVPILLDPRADYPYTNYSRYGNGSITADENIWSSLYFEDDDKSIYDLEKSKGLDFIRKNQNLTLNLHNEYDTKAGEKIVSLNFIGPVSEEDYREIVDFPLVVAVDDYRNYSLFSAPYNEHQFNSVKRATLEELSSMFSTEKTRF